MNPTGLFLRNVGCKVIKEIRPTTNRSPGWMSNCVDWIFVRHITSGAFLVTLNIKPKASLLLNLFPMKRLLPFLLLLPLLYACEQENPIIDQPELSSPKFFISYDGDNQDAPVLPGDGFFEAAQRLTPDLWFGEDSARLVEVYFFVQELPETASIRIYQGSTGDAPDSLVAEVALNPRTLASTSWNSVSLPTSILLDQDDIWVAMRFSHVYDTRSLGCDPGPAHPEGDWLYDSFDNQWIPLSERTSGAISINWNLRAVVLP